MTSSSEQAETVRPAVGLRERKKARTRSSIRSEAIRMFAEQGFAATTVEQIAEAAEISPSTFFRYFPTKEAVIVTDEYDPLILAAFRAQPPHLSVVRAFRNAVGSVLAELPPEAVEQERIRHDLLSSVPELRSAMLEQYADQLRELAVMIGERVGRPAGDLAVRTLAGAMIGVALSVTIGSWNSPLQVVDFQALPARFEAAFDLLDQGLLLHQPPAIRP
jgi:AcrR family transcriptional regulator